MQKKYFGSSKKEQKNVNLIKFNYISAIFACFYHGGAEKWRWF